MSFQRHGIQHLSPSSVNLWIANPRQWASRYLAREKEDASPAMWRGTAVETGLGFFWRGKSLEEACEAAWQSYELNAAGEISEDIAAERALIAPMLKQLAKGGTVPEGLNATQLRVEYWLDGIPIPCIGYLDFSFESFDLDCKTTKACPSKPRPDHLRQVALYGRARKKPQSILYVTDKRCATYIVSEEQMQQAMQEFADAAQSLSRFLGIIPDAETALACLPRNPDDFRTKLPKPPAPDPIITDVAF